jgi:hypothetical protein
MNAFRCLRLTVALAISFGFVAAATGIAEGQIFRRPSSRSAQSNPNPNPQPPRGLFPGRAARNQNQDGNLPGGAFSGGGYSGGTIPGSTYSGNTAGGSAAVPGRAVPNQAQPSQPEIFIVVPLDEKPFQIEPTDFVRLTAGGPPDCEFTTKIEGPARVYRKVFVAGAAEGKYTPGTNEAEYEFAMTGVGKVKIDVITTVPGGAAPSVMSYQFEVVPAKE